MIDYKSKYEEVHNLLVRANEHLEYCGFGDAWERECAKASGLTKDLEEYFRREETTNAKEN